MARVDKLAVWIAEGFLHERGVARTPAAMAAVMPVSYKLADAALDAVGEIVREIAAELARGAYVIPGIGDQVAEMDMKEWEAQLASSGQEHE